MTWQDDKKGSDKFIPEIKRILGEHLISAAPFDEDAERNTDLIVLRLDAIRIACRIRRNSYLEKYSNEFTIRSNRPSGAKTELAKIVEGWGNYFFYGFSNENESSLSAWVLGDLNVFRIWYNRELYKGNHPGQPKSNNDNSSSFLAFRIDELPKEFVVAKSS